MSAPTDPSPPREETCDSTLVRCSSPPHDDGILIDDLLLEIISRVPARERWRCKQVCNRWLRLAKMLPQSLAGFFYSTYSAERLPRNALHFVNISGNVNACFRQPVYFNFDFLPAHRGIALLDCQNGLLLCRLVGASAANRSLYVVCNPATQDWVTLPDRSNPIEESTIERLGFDPAASSHFHVFLFLVDRSMCISGVDLYSSKTGKWARMGERWDQDVSMVMELNVRQETVFLNGYLHFHADVVGDDDSNVPCLAAVASDGETWTIISPPTVTVTEDHVGFIQLSHGRLHYACFETEDDDDDDVDDDEDYEADVELAIYVLEDYDSKRWKLKHRVQTTDLFRALEDALVDRENLDADFEWIAIHPECNTIFFATGYPKQYMCYNMDLKKAKVMRPLKDGKSPYLPYVPLYTELQSLRM